MVTVQKNNPPAATLDACFIIGYCAKEPGKYDLAKARLEYYAVNGWQLFATGVIICEDLFVLARKLLSEMSLSQTEHANALAAFQELLNGVHPPPCGDFALVTRAEEIRANYGYARANDSIYIALAEHLAGAGASESELVTFDGDMKNQANQTAPSIKVHLLTI